MHVRAMVVADCVTVALCATQCLFTWCEARMWFQCVCRTGGEGTKGPLYYIPDSSPPLR